MSVQFKVPELGENIENGDIVKWLVKPGDVVQVNQPLMELETGKAVVEVPSSVSGKVLELLAKEGDKVNVGAAVLVVEGEAKEEVVAPPAKAAVAAEEPVQAPKSAPAPRPEEAHDGLGIPAAPVVKRIAREMGIDVASLKGTGPGGRITVEDVQAVAARRGGTVSAPAELPLPDFSRWGTVEVKPMSSVRRTTAQHLAQAWHSIPQVTQFDKADTQTIETLRKKYAPDVEKAGGKLTMTAILVKVLAAALERFPNFNVSVDLGANTIIYKKYIHIGVAVDTEFGLIVPVIRDADRKNIMEIAVELTKLSERTRKRQVAIEEMEGGSITITNVGGIGGTGFSPIVNWPEVAILGVTRAETEAVWNGKEFEPRLILPLSLSYDHRAVDGADAARFLRFVCEAVEEPFIMALEG